MFKTIFEWGQLFMTRFCWYMFLYKCKQSWIRAAMCRIGTSQYMNPVDCIALHFSALLNMDI